MQLLKPVLKFFGFFCLAYLLVYLFFGLKPVNDGHRAFYMKLTEPFLNTTMPKLSIKVKEGVRKEFAAENQINILFNSKEELAKTIAEARKKGLKQLEIKSEETAILFSEFVVIPLIFLLALIIATPLNWKDKIKAILIGILLLYLFFLIKTWIYTAQMVSTTDNGVFDFSPPFSNMLVFFGENLKMGASMIVGTLIWILVAVRKSEWKELMSGGS